MITYIKLDPIIYDWIEDNPISKQYIDYLQLYRWALNPIGTFTTVDTGVLKYAIVDILNTKGELPADWMKMESVAYRLYTEKEKCTTTKKVTEYIQKGYGDNFDLEIKVKCDKCKSDSCSCNDGVVEVNVDKIFQLENPWFWDGTSMSVPKHSRDFDKFSYDNGFRYMSHAHEPMWNAQKYVSQCLELELPENPKYRVDTPPIIEVNIPPNKEYRTELLIAYLGKRMDENGDYLVPDVPEAHDAIKYHLSYMFYRKMYLETEKPIYKRESSEAMALRDVNIGYTRDAVSNIETDKLKAYLSNKFNRYRAGGPTDNYFDPYKEIKY